ncbi:thiol-disulfide oxidoreductase DCC family protein [Alkalicoccus daliensis]|uniref:Predicted thiol-disulfide oxidoreductase YuxK, DCC family n=1 Tax=Alkalicoccus daliensis TaxID=745820 RepID=A0A1H0AJ08_9BACI|nr:DCC1-like thiol-disulfide oxidoreductase family protein [Alkalicoccus daliensis]SDN33568.1 Predicted thiol-disulfide oxidoreductase YuxK, DCC family [Alkalicoccus daliensis]
MRQILLFDGVCNLCNSAVNFIMKNDNKNQFNFASLQSNKGEELLREFKVPLAVESVVLIRADGRAFVKSDAVLEICSLLGGPLKILKIFKFFPRPLRDAMYDLIAKFRYRFFGKKETCRLPTKEERARFLS